MLCTDITTKCVERAQSVTTLNERSYPMDNTIRRNRLWCISYRLDGNEESTTMHRVAKDMTYDEAMEIVLTLENADYGQDYGYEDDGEPRYSDDDVYDLGVWAIEKAEHVEGQSFDIRAYIAI